MLLEPAFGGVHCECCDSLFEGDSLFHLSDVVLDEFYGVKCIHSVSFLKVYVDHFTYLTHKPFITL